MSGWTCSNFAISNWVRMPLAWNAFSIALDILLDAALIVLPRVNGNEDNNSTLQAPMLMTCRCQWLWSHTGKNSCVAEYKLFSNQALRVKRQNMFSFKFSSQFKIPSKIRI